MSMNINAASLSALFRSTGQSGMGGLGGNDGDSDDQGGFNLSSLTGGGASSPLSALMGRGGLSALFSDLNNANSALLGAMLGQNGSAQPQNGAAANPFQGLLDAMFNQASNGTGQLTQAQFTNMIKQMDPNGTSGVDPAKLFAQMDPNGTGVVTQAQFDSFLNGNSAANNQQSQLNNILQALSGNSAGGMSPFMGGDNDADEGGLGGMLSGLNSANNALLNALTAGSQANQSSNPFQDLLNAMFSQALSGLNQAQPAQPPSATGAVPAAQPQTSSVSNSSGAAPQVQQSSDPNVHPYGSLFGAQPSSAPASAASAPATSAATQPTPAAGTNTGTGSLVTVNINVMVYKYTQTVADNSSSGSNGNNGANGSLNLTA